MKHSGLASRPKVEQRRGTGNFGPSWRSAGLRRGVGLADQDGVTVADEIDLVVAAEVEPQLRERSRRLGSAHPWLLRHDRDDEPGMGAVELRQEPLSQALDVG